MRAFRRSLSIPDCEHREDDLDWGRTIRELGVMMDLGRVHCTRTLKGDAFCLKRERERPSPNLESNEAMVNEAETRHGDADHIWLYLDDAFGVLLQSLTVPVVVHTGQHVASSIPALAV